jgi:polyvinyl alcohol dehydrogenase (cytochrome)
MNCALTRSGRILVSLGLVVGAACSGSVGALPADGPAAGVWAPPTGVPASTTMGGVAPTPMTAGAAGGPAAVTPAGSGIAAGGATPPGPRGGASGAPAPMLTTPGSPDWISYGNGAKNWFNATGETKITVENAASLTMKWMVNSDVVNGTPSVVGDMVYVVTNSGTKAFKAADGSIAWMSAAARGQTSPAYDPETKTLFVSAGGLQAGPGNMFAFDALSGMMKWGPKPVTEQSGSTGWASPVVVGKYVATGVCAFDVASSFKGGLAAFDKVSGERVLTYQHATTAGAGVWSGVSGDEAAGILYAGSSNNYGSADNRSDSLFAVSIMDSKLLWNFQATEGDTFTLSSGGGEPDYDFGTHPIVLDVGGKRLLAAGQKSGMFWARDRDTGQPAWEFKAAEATGGMQATGGILNNGAFDGERIITAANQGQRPGNVYALEAGTGEMVWKKALTGLVWAPITVANGVCFVPDNTTLRILNCATGDELKTIMVPKTVGSGVAISNGRIFFGSGWDYTLSGAGATSGGPYQLYSFALP